MVDVEKAREHLAALLGIVVARYHLTEPYDGAAAAAIQAAIKDGKDADLAGLRRLLVEDYNLYPHHETLALAELDGAAIALDDSKPVIAVTRGKPLNQQNKSELLATAAARGLEVPEGSTVIQLREALASVGFEEPEAPAELPETSSITVSSWTPMWTDKETETEETETEESEAEEE